MFGIVQIVYFLGNFARARGEAIEPELWKRWGGPPSTRMLRNRDSQFGDDLKASIREALAATLSARLITPDEEAKNPERADKVIVDAFRQVRQYLRQHDPDGLWQKQNIEYGFCRTHVMNLGGELAFRPQRMPLRNRQSAEAIAARFGATLQDVSIRTSDGSRLRGWFGSPVHTNRDAVILLHGVGDNREGLGGFGTVSFERLRGPIARLTCSRRE
jgi:hypothetical protein